MWHIHIHTHYGTYECDIFICSNVTYSYVQMWHIHMSNVSYSYVQMWHIHMSNVSYSYVQMWHIHMSNVSYSHVQMWHIHMFKRVIHFICVTSLIWTHSRATWHIYIHKTQIAWTHSWCDTFTYTRVMAHMAYRLYVAYMCHISDMSYKRQPMCDVCHRPISRQKTYISTKETNIHTKETYIQTKNIYSSMTRVIWHISLIYVSHSHTSAIWHISLTYVSYRCICLLFEYRSLLSEYRSLLYEWRCYVTHIAHVCVISLRMSFVWI